MRSAIFLFSTFVIYPVCNTRSLRLVKSRNNYYSFSRGRLQQCIPPVRLSLDTTLMRKKTSCISTTRCVNESSPGSDVTAMVAVSVVDLLILQTSLPPFDLWLLSQIHILSLPSSSDQHQHQTNTNSHLKAQHHDRRLVPQCNRHPQPRRRRLSSRRSSGIKIIPSLPHQHRRMLTPTHHSNYSLSLSRRTPPLSLGSCHRRL